MRKESGEYLHKPGRRKRDLKEGRSELASAREQERSTGIPDKKTHLINIPKIYIKITSPQNLRLMI